MDRGDGLKREQDEGERVVRREGCGGEIPGGGAESGQGVCVGLVTSPPGDAQRIASELVERGLAACCNVLSPVTSIFNWKGVRQTESEALILVKTTMGRAVDLIDCVREIHPYDLPEIIFLPVASGLSEYLMWVRGECGSGEDAE